MVFSSIASSSIFLPACTFILMLHASSIIDLGVFDRRLSRFVLISS